jgi:phage/conjugal plasmid C-4 type zinc finger TraR family protein
MDDIDLASKLIEKTIQKAIDDNKNKLKDSGIKHCIDCDIKIPLKRKVAVPSCKRCIDCENFRG